MRISRITIHYVNMLFTYWSTLCNSLTYHMIILTPYPRPNPQDMTSHDCAWLWRVTVAAWCRHAKVSKHSHVSCEILPIHLRDPCQQQRPSLHVNSFFLWTNVVTKVPILHETDEQMRENTNCAFSFVMGGCSYQATAKYSVKMRMCHLPPDKMMWKKWTNMVTFNDPLRRQEPLQSNVVWGT